MADASSAAAAAAVAPPPPPRSGPAVSDANLRRICEFYPATRYATPNGNGYMPLAFSAADRRARRAAEGGTTAGFGLFFFNAPAEEEDDDAAAPAAPARPPACRGCFLMREEKETVKELQAGGGKRYLTISAVPATLLEEYLPLVRWWLPTRFADATTEAETETETTAAPEAMGVQLFLRDARNKPTQQQQQQQQQQRGGTAAVEDAVVARQRTHEALAIYNAVCLLTALPRGPTFLGLECLKLVGFAMSPLLWDTIARAGRTITVLNLSCCNNFADPLAVGAMRQQLMGHHNHNNNNNNNNRPNNGSGNGDDGKSNNDNKTGCGCLPLLEALVIPATDSTNAVLRALILATEPNFRLRYVNIGECAAITDLSALTMLKGTLRHLHAYSLPNLEPQLAVEAISRAGAATLETLGLSRCTSLTQTRPLGRLRALRRLDLQGCARLQSLAGVVAGEGMEAEDGAGCTALQQLWLTGCDALNLRRRGDADADADDAALWGRLWRALPQLQELQAGHAPMLGGAAALEEGGSFVVDLSAAAAAGADGLRLLSLALCTAVTEVRFPSAAAVGCPGGLLRALAALDLSGTRITDATLIGLCGRPSSGSSSSDDNAAAAAAGAEEGGEAAAAAAAQEGEEEEEKEKEKEKEKENVAIVAPNLHTLILNGCTELQDFTLLRRLPALRRLSLCGTHVTGEQLAPLSQQLPRLQALYLNHCRDITTFAPLRLFRTLRVLGLAGTRATHSALLHFSNVPFLQVLSLQGSEVTDLAKLSHSSPYLRLVECSAKKVIKNTAPLRRAGVSVDTEAATPPLHPPMAFLS